MEEDEVEWLKRDNKKLKTELIAQQAVCQKLRDEKDFTNNAFREAEEEIEQLQQELYLREQQFQTMRETKENEIASLKQIIHDMEVQLSDFPEMDLDHSGDSADETDNAAVSLVVPDLPASQIVHALSEWEGMEDSISLFKDLLISESSCARWTPGSLWTIKWKYALSLYISAPSDVTDVLEEIMQNCVPIIQKMCQDSGCSITPVRVNAEELLGQGITPDDLRALSSWLVQHCDLFVGVFRDHMSILTKLETENGYLNNPSSKHALFIFLPCSEKGCSQPSNQKMTKFKDRIRKCGVEGSAIIECGYNYKSSVDELKNRLCTSLNKNFHVWEQDIGSTISTDFENIALWEDMRVECEQRGIYEQVVKDTAPMEENSVVFDKLDEYVLEESQVKAVCVLLGAPGSGKSTLLSNWVKKLADSGEVYVMYHFVKILGSSSAEVCCLFRRLLQQTHLVTKENVSLPRRPNELADMFVKSLKKVPTVPPKKFVVVIDNIDQIKDYETYFSWMLKPLPSAVRVVVSSCEENIPELWRLLPSISIPSFTYTDAIDLVDGIQKMNKVKPLSPDQISSLGLNAAYSPLWCTMATKHVLCCVKLGMEDEEVDDLVDGYAEYEGFVDLLRHIFEDLNTNLPNLFSYVCKVLQLLYWSRNGLSLCEIQRGMNISSSNIIFLLFLLVRRNIVLKTEGLYYIHNVQSMLAGMECSSLLVWRWKLMVVKQQLQVTNFAASLGRCQAGSLSIINRLLSGTIGKVQEAIEDLLCTEHYMLTWTEVLIDVFSNDRSLISRQIEELLWLFKRAELKKELYYTILNVDILRHMYASYRVGELIEYWLYLHPEETMMCSQYFKQVKTMEIEDTEDHPQSYFVSLCGSIGKVLMGLGYLEEALPVLQYSLELCESYCDPESLDIAQLLVDLGKLNYLAGRYITAEGYLTEALHIYEAVYSEDSTCILQILEELEKSLLKLDKPQLTDIITTRIFSIKQISTGKQKACKLLMSRFSELEERVVRDDYDDPQKKASCFNENAVILGIFGDFGLAEKRMMEVITLLESGDDSMLTSSLVNLGKLYLHHNRLDLATVLFEKAYELVNQPKYKNKEKWFLVTDKLSILYRTQGRMKYAEPLQRQILHYLIQEFGQDHLRVAKALNNLAVLYCHMGQFEESVPLYEEAIRLYEFNLGEEHETVVLARNNMKLASESKNYNVNET